MTHQSTRLVHLDMLRGLAALAVVAGHVRGLMLTDYSDIVQPGVGHKIFYALTSLGHEAVIAFFALSGYLVGGAALTDMRQGRWSWQRYMITRLSRLWTVVVPALVLTLVLDRAGIMLTSGAGYDGRYFDLLASGPGAANPVDQSWRAFLINLTFLQTIAGPVYGSNGPLWSLANEFWYYLVFPMAMAAVLVANSPFVRIALALLGAGIAWLLPGSLMLLGIIWAVAAILAHAQKVTRLSSLTRSWVYLAATLVSVLLAIAYRRSSAPGEGRLIADLLLGLAWALTLPGLTQLPAPWRLYRRVATAMSELSFTLYAVHFPFIAFIWFVAVAPRQWPPDAMGLSLAAALLVAAVAVAAAMWWLFERNTMHVRACLMRWAGFEPGGSRSS